MSAGSEQPFPSSLALSSLSTNRFSFLGVQSSDSRELGGREAAICLLGSRGLWESRDVGGSMAMWAVWREEENCALWGCIGQSSWDALVPFCSLGAGIILLIFSLLLNVGELRDGVGNRRIERL